jgi:hypothetical protein
LPVTLTAAVMRFQHWGEMLPVTASFIWAETKKPALCLTWEQ